MANRGIQRILINLNGDSSLINTKIMNYINNSGLIIIKKKFRTIYVFFSFANIIHSYLNFLFTTLFGFQNKKIKKPIICSMDYISDLSLTNLPTIISFVCVSKAVNNQS
jgi:hypothetical protein